MAEYAKRIGNEQLAKNESQLSEQLKTKIQTKKSNLKEPVTARQSKQSFLLWVSFVLFLMIGGGICAVQFAKSILGDLGAVVVTISFFALPVAVVWLILWLIGWNKEWTDQNKEGAK